MCMEAYGQYMCVDYWTRRLDRLNQQSLSLQLFLINIITLHSSFFCSFFPPAVLSSCREFEEMDVLLSALLGELTTRSINFIISKYSKPMPLDVKDCLRRLLLRAQVIIDEAMGRHITNQAMLLQLVTLRDAMHRG